MKEGALNILGFPFDGTACFRKGARFGPNAIRSISNDLETYSPYLDLDLEDFTYYDLGNIGLESETFEQHKAVQQRWKNDCKTFQDLSSSIQLPSNHTRILTLGGEHSISLNPIKKYLNEFPKLHLIHLDAHADLRDGYQGYTFSHASIMFRASEHFKAGHKLIQYGIRSGTREEFQWMKRHKSLATSSSDFLSQVQQIPSEEAIYLTLDLDFFDPAYLPGTGTPEAGGEDFHLYVKLIKVLEHKNLVGADVTELAPNIDQSGNSSVFASKVIRELILLLAHSK